LDRAAPGRGEFSHVGDLDEGVERVIIFGTKGVTKRLDAGTFTCPECGSPQNYEHKKVERYGHIYWIPLLPMGEAADYVECQGCKGTFRSQVLSPEYQQPDVLIRAEYENAIRRVMVLMMLADGSIADEEVQTIKKIHEALTENQLTAGDIRDEVAVARREEESIVAYLQRIEPYVNNQGKELILKAAIHVAMADGDFDEEEVKLLLTITACLGLTAAHLKGVMAEMTGQ
jgi:tellurite resistance protein